MACTVSNRLRNRYHDIVPYDANRVKLQETVKLEGESAGSNYINASYVQTPSGDGGDKRRGSALSSSPSANAIAAARQNNERGVGNAYIAGQVRSNVALIGTELIQQSWFSIRAPETTLWVSSGR